MQFYPRAPDLFWPGHLHGTGCVSARPMDTDFPTVVWCLCFRPGLVWARVSAAPRQSWLGCWVVCVLVCPLRLYPATPGWGVRPDCVCLGSGLGPARPLLAGVLGCVCVRVPAPLVLRHSWLGCVVWVYVWARGSAAPRHSWLGCVFVRVRAPFVPRHSWLGCVLWVCVRARVFAASRQCWLGCWGVCVFVCPLRLYPATPGWAVRRVCVCLGFGFGCAPPSLA